jgi:myo-inositol-1-phosphate synthase
MMQNELLTKGAIATIGEEIGYELGAQLVKDYQVANPSDVHSYMIGRDIIDQILAQPGCVGIKFFNAYNEMGEKTLVYIGLDANGKTMVEQTVVTNDGVLTTEKGIVADRARSDRPYPGTTPEIGDEDLWGWID